jgi:hypothetical protein
MDGKSLFYLKGERGYVSELWKVPVDGGEKANPIATIRKWVGLGFSVSPDEHWILYTEWEGGRANLMLVENFR